MQPSRTKKSTQRHHNNLKDCQSNDRVVDTLVANKQVTAQEVNTRDLNLVRSFGFPENWDEQFRDHFVNNQKTLHIPRLLNDSTVIQKSLIVRDATETGALTVHNSLDVFGNAWLHGTAHFFGKVVIHGEFQVDQGNGNMLKRALPEPVIPLPPPQIVSVPVSPISPIQFSCKNLDADELKVRNGIQTRHLFVKSCDVKELTSEQIEGKLATISEIQCDTVHASSIHCQEIQVPSILGQAIHVDTLNVDHDMKVTKASIGEVDAQNIQAKTLTSKKIIAGESTHQAITVNKTLNVDGDANLHKASCSELEVKDGFSVAGRMDLPYGKPIQMHQPIHLNNALCLNHYQYWFIQTNSSSSAPTKHSITMDKSILVINADVDNVLSVSIRFPSDPLPGQTLMLTSSPSISVVQLHSTIPILNPVTSFGIGSHAQYLYVDQARKWFRTA